MITKLQATPTGEIVGGYQHHKTKPANYETLVTLAREDDAAPIWSGKYEPPCIGDVVNVAMNNIGRARVLGFIKEAGFLGLHVQPLEPPAWYVKQNGKDTPCHVFGAELSRHRVMIMMLDPMGLPRAYGAAPYELQAERVAREQLAIYCAKKKALGDLDLADPNNFRLKREVVE